MNVIEVIEKKKDGTVLTFNEIKYLIDNYVNGNIPDYQMSAWLMACYFNKLTIEETAYLTKAMILSGQSIDLSTVEGIKVDKHSTGGVGDAVTLVLAPILASCGLPIVKMSGRGLGHTGGTLDKLSAIKGIDYDMSIEQIVTQAKDIGIVLAGQTAQIVPADKLLYALRDVTGTVNDLSLIASSIMSKKIAMGTDIILLDVKVGSGAFMKSIEDARKLAKVMVALGQEMDKKVVAFITDMEQPLGMTIGNAIEIKEVVEILKDSKECDLSSLSIQFASKLLIMAGLAKNDEMALTMVKKKLSNGDAFKKFQELVQAEKGDISLIQSPDMIELGRTSGEIIAEVDGYLHRCDALLIGRASFELGAGREKIEDQIDLGAGIEIYKKVGDRVNVGDRIAKLYTNKKGSIQTAKDLLREAFLIKPQKISKRTLIYEIITVEDIV